MGVVKKKTISNHSITIHKYSSQHRLSMHSSIFFLSLAFQLSIYFSPFSYPIYVPFSFNTIYLRGRGGNANFISSMVYTAKKIGFTWMKVHINLLHTVSSHLFGFTDINSTRLQFHQSYIYIYSLVSFVGYLIECCRRTLCQNQNSILLASSFFEGKKTAFILYPSTTASSLSLFLFIYFGVNWNFFYEYSKYDVVNNWS